MAMGRGRLEGGNREGSSREGSNRDKERVAMRRGTTLRGRRRGKRKGDVTDGYDGMPG